MKELRRSVIAFLVCGMLSCAPPPPPPPLPPAAVAEPFPASEVWTSRENVALVVDDQTAVALAEPFLRLHVIGRDTVGLRVQCDECEGSPTGYVSEDDILFQALPPEVAAWGELAEFALAIRAAAADNDVSALLPVMAPDFTHAFVGVQTPDAAAEVWQSEGFTTLQQVPNILDTGLATRDGRIWSAPSAFITDPGYRGLRLGFRQRADGRWEWLYLIRGITG